MDLWDWFIDLWFIARLRQYLQDRAYARQRERAWAMTEIAVAREGDTSTATDGRNPDRPASS